MSVVHALVSMNSSYTPEPQVFQLSEADSDIRARFIRRTYLHLAVALLAFLGLEAVLIQTPAVVDAALRILEMPFGWLGVLGAFMLVGWVCTRMAHGASRQVQYLGLTIYVVAEALIFVPLVLLALSYAGPDLLVQAVLMTGLLFAGLTATVFMTRTDFSFLRTGLIVGSFVALGLIIGGVVFGFNLGLAFSGFMIVFAGAAILYDTSNVLHHYREDQYVGAALQLFAAVALLLWYVIRLLISLGDD